jgi:hypothetical protein
MKKLTCRELGGACDVEITGNSFVEIGNASMSWSKLKTGMQPTARLLRKCKMPRQRSNGL